VQTFKPGREGVNKVKVLLFFLYQLGDFAPAFVLLAYGVRLDF